MTLLQSLQAKEQWIRFAAAALTGLLSAETPGSQFGHRAEAAALAATTADFLLDELQKRDRTRGGRP